MLGELLAVLLKLLGLLLLVLDRDFQLLNLLFILVGHLPHLLVKLLFELLLLKLERLLDVLLLLILLLLQRRL